MLNYLMHADADNVIRGQQFPNAKICQDLYEQPDTTNKVQSVYAYTQVACPACYASDSEHEPPDRVTPPIRWSADEAEAHPPVLLYICWHIVAVVNCR